MRNGTGLGLLSAVLLAGCSASGPADTPTARERLTQKIELGLQRRGIAEMDLSQLSLNQLKAISHILGNDESEGQKAGRIAAVVRRG